MFEHIHLKADYCDLVTVISWVRENLSHENISTQVLSRMVIVTEEMFTNVAKYGYPKRRGDIDITYSSDNEKISMIFEDSGIPFDPTKAEKPDITVPVDDKIPGGLGIHITRLFLDDMTYKRENGRNILTVVKNK